MRIVQASAFEGQRAWDALNIAEIDAVTIRLHWTDQPYVWHVNDGPEVFVVLDGSIDMLVRQNGIKHTHRLTQGSIFHAEHGDAHRAVPLGVARALVIERAGSI